MGYADLGGYGEKEVKTLHLDSRNRSLKSCRIGIHRLRGILKIGD
jgi:hypothetical protein